MNVSLCNTKNQLNMFVVFFVTLATCSGVLGQFQFGLGTTAPPGGKSFDPNCTDKMNSCWQMPESNCRAPYEEWAKQYCPNRCGYCVGPTTPAPPCVNKLTNCESYDKSVCTSPDYTTWAGENCRYFCRMCSPAELLRLDSITTTIKPEDCVDKVDCRQYGTNACSEAFKAWSKDNCANYCGYCQGIPTPPPVCEDKIPNCKAYNPDTCTNPDYDLWVNDNCKRFCGRCKDSPIIPYVPPTPMGPGKRNVPAKRQFEASHHHQGGTHDCWDGTTTDPYCLTQAPDESTTASSSLENSAGFPGSEFKPHPKPDLDWDSKPSTEAPFTTTEKTKLPVTTEAAQVTNDTAMPPLATGNATPVRHTITENPDLTASPSTAAPQITQTVSSATDAPQVTQTITGTTDSPQVTQSVSGATYSPQVTQTTSEATDSPQVTQTASGATDSPQVTQTASGATDSPQVTQAASGATDSPQVTQTVSGAPQTDQTVSSATAFPSVTQTVTASATGSGASVSLSTPSPTGPPPFITGSTTVQAPQLLTNGTMKAETSASTVGTNAPPSLVTVQSTEKNTHMQSGNTREHTTHAQTPQQSTATTVSSANASTTENATTSEPCVDTVDNCALYGKQACTEPVYRPWAKAHCSAFCEFCIPVTLTPFVCKDKLANCREFDSGDLCTADSYFAWSRENCFAYCGFPPCNKATEPTTTKKT